jgi:23S rRNA maturation mini-RNase III
MPINTQRGTDPIKRNKVGILDLVVIKNAAAYQDATALDALIGYLYFPDRMRHEDFRSELDVSIFA